VKGRVLLAAGDQKTASVFEIERPLKSVATTPELRLEIFAAKWDGRYGDEEVHIRAVTPGRLEISWADGTFHMADVPPPIVDIRAAAGVLAVVAGSGVYRLDLTKLGARIPRHRPVTTFRDEVVGVILFPPGSWALSLRARREIEVVASKVKGIEGERPIVILGYTDPTGSRRRNELVALRRAQAVQQVLGEAGVPASRLTSRGLGIWSRLRRASAESRRVEIHVEMPTENASVR
jgi:outer membrane protein OmpA-like peptidoglycan-associated protein